MDEQAIVEGEDCGIPQHTLLDVPQSHLRDREFRDRGPRLPSYLD